MTHNIDIPGHLSFDTSTYTWITFFLHFTEPIQIPLSCSVRKLPNWKSPMAER